MPAYNAERWIAQSISSALAQTFGDFELIIVDDGSSDDTRQVVQSFSDKRLHYFHQENRGLPAARNTGLQVAKGDYLAFLDADDLWEASMLQTCFTFLETHPESDVVRTGYLWIDADNHPLPGLPFCPPCNEDAFACIALNAVGVMQTTMLKREILSRVGEFDAELRTAEDWDLLLRIAAAGGQFGFVPQRLFRYRIHGKNKTAVYNERIRNDELRPIHKVFGNTDVSSRYGYLKAKIIARKLVSCCIHAFDHDLISLALEDYTQAATNDCDTLFDPELYYRIACANVPIGYPPNKENIDFERGQHNVRLLAKYITQMKQLPKKAKRVVLGQLHLALGMVYYGVTGDMASARRSFASSLHHNCWNGSAWPWLLRSTLGKNLLDRFRA